MKKTDAVPDLFHAGLTPAKVATQLGISRTTVYKIKKLKVTGKVNRKSGSGRPRTSRTKAIIAKVKQCIKSNPVRSMRNVSNSSVQRVVKCDLKMKSMARVKVS